MNIHSIAPGRPFLDLLARWWIDGAGKKPDPLAVADGLAVGRFDLAEATVSGRNFAIQNLVGTGLGIRDRSRCRRGVGHHPQLIQLGAGDGDDLPKGFDRLSARMVAVFVRKLGHGHVPDESERRSRKRPSTIGTTGGPGTTRPADTCLSATRPVSPAPLLVGHTLLGTAPNGAR